MSEQRMVTIDGNEAATTIAHLTNEVIAIYPITPASPMGELADEWSADGRKNLWGTVPHIVEMQSEGGAAAAIHGVAQAGALTTTFTASQGLLLMIPTMYKVAGELTPMVIHVAARSLACQALSIFCDHGDVMATRATGFALLASNSVQEAHDMALVAQAATLESRVPFLHFFDGFRTSHEVSKVSLIDHDAVRAMIREEFIHAHRARALNPEHPVVRGTSQNPDAYFQARESVNPFYDQAPDTVQAVMDRLGGLTGRHYRLFDYAGAPDAERVIVIMGSGAETVEETVNHLVARGEKVGVLKVRLFRPFASARFIEALPRSVLRIAVLDRTKEPGADGEPLYKDAATAILGHAAGGGEHFKGLPRLWGGRYGLSSKEFTPGMVKSVFDGLKQGKLRNPFTVGIIDDVTFTSVEWDPLFRTDAMEGVVSAVFYGLGSDGTVSANKNSIKIIGEQTDLHTQGYFVYDSKKAGAVTVSHLRFGPRPIRSPYLVGEGEAGFVACHQPVFLERYEMLDKAAEGGVFLLNAAESPDQVWDSLPRRMQQQMIEKKLRFYTIDAYRVAQETGMGRRINTIMQTCFFAISGILPREDAIKRIKHAVEETYGKRGKRIVEQNFHAIDATLANLHEVPVPGTVSSSIEQRPPVPDDAPEFIRKVTGPLIAGYGDHIPVSLFPPDGTWPVGTARLEKRNLALEIPVWDEELCIHCGKCPLVCPHAAIRSQVFPAGLADTAPPTFKHVPVKGKEFPEGSHITYQVAPEDCTGCGLCVEICPAHDKSNVSHKALNMAPQPPLREQERENWAFFTTLPEFDRTSIRWSTLKGAMLGESLFEFSSACVGCGETPYLKLATQLFGDRMLVANATGCSSIYGGNLPTTPWTTNQDGRGPAWSNSLFEDNAEFGLGFRLAIDKQNEYARELLERLAEGIGPELVEALLTADQSDEAGILAQRGRVADLRERLTRVEGAEARDLEAVADALVKKSVWIVGGDGWAYDIGFGGLDHVLATGKNVNLLVLDTEVYSNTGGQTSKATPRGAVAKFSAGGKPTAKKDLSLLAMAYENVYVAHVAYGAKDIQTLKAFLEAEAHDGPSLIIAYSPCIAHGVDLAHNLRQQDLAVRSGHWPLLRFNPANLEAGRNPLQLDSKPPDIPYTEFASTETRFSMLKRMHPETADRLLAQAQHEITTRYNRYQQLAGLSVEEEEEGGEGAAAGEENQEH
jgi:pyruvate-ferredoxin/flavodoxin oxidoreductase